MSARQFRDQQQQQTASSSGATGPVNSIVASGDALAAVLAPHRAPSANGHGTTPPAGGQSFDFHALNGAIQQLSSLLAGSQRTNASTAQPSSSSKAAFAFHKCLKGVINDWTKQNVKVFDAWLSQCNLFDKYTDMEAKNLRHKDFQVEASKS